MDYKVKVVILAGGLGTRLAEETEVKPKPMVEIGGRPILWHIMKHYAYYDFKEFFIALGYKGESIKRFFLDYCHLNGDLTVRLARNKVERHTEQTDDWTVHLIDTENVQPTHLLHIAWFAEPGKYWTSSENIRWVQASLDLLLTFALHGGRRVVMAGTCAEYDWKYGYCSECVTPLSPTSLYGVCKHSLQILLDAFAKQTGLSAAWGRIFFLYGPYEHPSRLVASVVRAVLQGEPARCSYGNQIRDFLHVQDVADAFVALLDHDISGSVNIASGLPVALKDVIFIIAEKAGRRDLIQLGALPVPADEPPLLVADVSRLHNEVCWRPKYDLDTGLEQTIQWWKTRMSLG